MNHKDLLTEMKKSIGTQNPIIFFEKMTSVLELLFDKIESLENQLNIVKNYSALAIKWEPKLASSLLTKQINILRQDKEVYFDEIDKLKQAFMEDKVTQSYKEFCEFWEATLGFHPFLNYK